MNPEELFTAARRQPFVPFRLHVSDGSAYDIRHPEIILVTRRTATIAVPAEPGKLPHHSVTIAMLHMSRLEELEAAKASGNGQ